MKRLCEMLIIGGFLLGSTAGLQAYTHCDNDKVYSKGTSHTYDRDYTCHIKFVNDTGSAIPLKLLGDKHYTIVPGDSKVVRLHDCKSLMGLKNKIFYQSGQMKPGFSGYEFSDRGLTYTFKSSSMMRCGTLGSCVLTGVEAYKCSDGVITTCLKHH